MRSIIPTLPKLLLMEMIMIIRWQTISVCW